jgi:SecD/SecF fusion protein
MQRNFSRATLICLIPLLLAAWASWSAYEKWKDGKGGFKLGVDLVGGTILVYEVDPRRTELLRGTKQASETPADPSEEVGPKNVGLSKKEMQDLAAALKRRIDPTDLKNVTIRPVGSTRIEIILPISSGASAGGGKSGEKTAFTEEEILEVRKLVKQVGSLEFRILANNEDDKEAIDAARTLIEGLTPEQRSDLAQRGEPPPAPEGTFDVRGLSTNYAWLELDKEERMSLELNNDRELDATGSSLWSQVATARNEGKTFLQSSSGSARATSMLLYSRKCEVLNEKVRNEKKYEYWVLTRVKDSVQVAGNVSINASTGTSSDYRIAVDFRFNSEGARQFRKLTSRNKPTALQGDTQLMRHLAIVLDGMVKSAPTINSVIDNSGQITGNYQREDAEQLVFILKSGALTAVLKEDPVSEYTIGPTLGQETIKSGTSSVGLAFLAVLAFMLVYYRFAGTVATIALFANLLLTIGFMVMVNGTFTLPGLAGLVLMLGMAVDANVLIYERVREERERGASLQMAIRAGYDKAFPTIIDTHLSSIITAIILYAVGNDQLKGFGISLTVGLVISLFTSLYMTRLMFDYALSKRWLSNLKMFKFFSRPNFDFMAIRKPIFVFSAAVSIVGVALFLLRGRDGLNIDFLGGTAYTGVLKPGKEMEIDQLRKLLLETRQVDLLKVEKVEPILVDGKTTNQWRIFYAGAKDPNVVTLSKAPTEDSPEARQNLLDRASRLPDWSMEQIFDSESTGNKSKLFTVRTTEREQELVKVMISRLMVESGEPLLKQISIAAKPLDKDNKSWQLSFLDSNQQPVAASVSYLKTFITNVITAKHPELARTELFDIVGEGAPEEGRYKSARLNFVREAEIPTLKDPKALQELVETASRDFTTSPQPERLENVDETLADEMKVRALYAILASWLAILGYLWFRFGNWTFGLAAVICLVHDLCFTLGVIAFSHYLHDGGLGKALLLQDFKIDLPAIAALLTLVGFSVNDTIVVFDRIREVRGKSPKLTPEMINESINQTLSRTVLTSLTVFLVVAVLYMFGGEGVHLFAFVMVVGVLIGTFSSIYIASPLLLIFKEGAAEDRDYSKSPKEPEASAEDEPAEEEEEAVKA